VRDWYRHGDVRVIGNLPYSVGGEIMKRRQSGRGRLRCPVRAGAA
jgi:16S rRNA A1518/A1519 N6-dimethyltransferase RsmA/KsgA/DIM1 with predicted DNA glycosylase/AP lyase activity